MGNIAGNSIGVAPFSRQSGQYKGVERISDGRFHPRRVLYTCVMVGIRYNPIIKAYYEMYLMPYK